LNLDEGSSSGLELVVLNTSTSNELESSETRLGLALSNDTSNVVDTRERRAVNTVVSETRASTTRFEVLVSGDTLVDNSVTSGDGARGPTRGADVDRSSGSKGSSGGADGRNGDAASSTDLEAVVACKGTVTGSTLAVSADGITKLGDGVGTLSVFRDDTTESCLEEVEDFVDTKADEVQG